MQNFHVSNAWLRMSEMPRKILTFHIFHDEYGTIWSYDWKNSLFNKISLAPPLKNTKIYILTPFQDSALVIEKFKSGFLPPGDIPFEDLSSLDNMSGRATINIFWQCDQNIFTPSLQAVSTRARHREHRQRRRRQYLVQ